MPINAHYLRNSFSCQEKLNKQWGLVDAESKWIN